jgi:uncharacterized protein
MPLLVNLRHLVTRDVVLQGELSVEELAMDSRDPMIRVTRPLQYDLQVEKVNESVLVTGALRIVLDCQCVWCLEPFEYTLELNGPLSEVPLQGEDAAPVASDCVDLTPYLREDIFLEFPRHPLCKPECRGLAGKPADQSKPPGAEAGQPPSSAWEQLNKLKL